MASNKSFRKRFKVTKNGKFVSRSVGQNHFNAKQKGEKRMHKRRTAKKIFGNKIKSRYVS